MEQLTPTQRRALDFIHSFTSEHGIPPTLRDICSFMGYSAVGSAQDLVNALKRKGVLEVPAAQKARAIIPSSKGRDTLGIEAQDHDPMVFSIPCLGRVPAGNPIEALEDRIGTLRLSTSFLPRPQPKRGDLFALRADGESMIEAGILDGDWLVVKKDPRPVEQSIVVALVGGDATVKRLCSDAKRGWFLKPENPRFQPIYGENKPFSIIGQVIALQRTFLKM